MCGSGVRIGTVRICHTTPTTRKVRLRARTACSAVVAGTATLGAVESRIGTSIHLTSVTASTASALFFISYTTTIIHHIKLKMLFVIMKRSKPRNVETHGRGSYLGFSVVLHQLNMIDGCRRSKHVHVVFGLLPNENE